MNELYSLVIVIPFILFVTPVAAILRSEIVYWFMLLASLLFPWIAYEIVQNNLGNYDDAWFVVSISSTTVLGLYKLFDWVILKLYDRHLFITWRGHHLPINEGWLDALMQFILIFLPLLWVWIGQAIFG